MVLSVPWLILSPWLGNNQKEESWALGWCKLCSDDPGGRQRPGAGPGEEGGHLCGNKPQRVGQQGCLRARRRSPFLWARGHRADLREEAGLGWTVRGQWVSGGGGAGGRASQGTTWHYPRDRCHRGKVSFPPKMLWLTSPGSKKLRFHSVISSINLPQTLLD